MSRVLQPSFKPVLKQPADLLQDRSDVGCKTLLNFRVLNSAISQLVLQQFCNFLLPVLPYHYVRAI